MFSSVTFPVRLIFFGFLTTYAVSYLGMSSFWELCLAVEVLGVSALFVVFSGATP